MGFGVGARVQLNRATVVLTCESRQRMFTLPEGAVVTLVQHDDHFVTVVWEARPYQMFSIDLDERGSLVRATKVG